MNVSNEFSIPSVLSIAGFDGLGGAGIQADNKTFAALGCYGLNVLSALTIQNTLGVKEIVKLPIDSFKDQLDCIFEDSYPNAIKIGMLHSKEQFKVLKSYLKDYKGFVIYDPVLISSSGFNFINQQELLPSIHELLPYIDLLTPNLIELSFMLSKNIQTVEEMMEIIPIVSSWACKSTLIKGGHLSGNEITHILIDSDQTITKFHNRKIDSKNTHGTGCTLSSAIACFMTKGYSLKKAVEQSNNYVFDAILKAKDLKLGQGKGGLIHHFLAENNPFI